MLQLRRTNDLVKGKQYFLVCYNGDYHLAEWTGRVFDDHFQVFDEPEVFKEIYLIEDEV